MPFATIPQAHAELYSVDERNRTSTVVNHKHLKLERLPLRHVDVNFSVRQMGLEPTTSSVLRGSRTLIAHLRAQVLSLVCLPFHHEDVILP